MKKTLSLTSYRGFSIVELLIAILIILVLAGILVPNVAQYAAKSRVARARTELKTLADAQERVATDLGYYVRLFALDDSSRSDGGDGSIDGILDEPYNTPPPIDPGRTFIRISDHTILSLTAANDVRNNKINTSSTVSTAWNGPYITIQEDDPVGATPEFLRIRGIPNDPWGNDYLLVLRDGVVYETASGNITIQPTITVEGVTADADGIFDRPAIYSLGPDGIPSNPLGDPSGDDLWHVFGY